jgi:membrane-associated phospholipid phosphatase
MLGLTALWCVLWVLVPRYATFTTHMLPVTWLERDVPFVEPFVYVYLSICLFMPAGPLLTVSRPMLVRHGEGFLAITLVAFGCFVLYPIEVPAPAVAAETFLYQLLLSDTRLNSLPSLHAAYTVYSLLYWRCLLPELSSRRLRDAVAALVTGWALVILSSIFLIKQHYLLDVVAGIALALVAHWVVVRKATERAPIRLARFTTTREIKS